MSSNASDDFWCWPREAIFRQLEARPEGLSSAEAAKRLVRFGANVAVAGIRRSLWRKVAKKLSEPLIAILLLAAAVSAASGDWRSFVIIGSIVLMSVALDVIQEQKAENTVEALRTSVAVNASVRRDGRVAKVPVKDLAPGDVVELTAGDLVPADGIVLSSSGALAHEALLTGEPYPTEKSETACAPGTPLGEACNALFSGTSLVGGGAVMLVVATGAGTRFGAIAASLQDQVPPSAFERGVHALGMLILRLTGFLVLFVLLFQLARQGLTLESFLFAVALAVGLTPELLPMVMTVTLSRGAIRMAKKRVVVKRLAAIHDLGAMDVLCTDKTGTLTEARISLLAAQGIDGAESPRVRELAWLNSHFASELRNNLDDAILARATADAAGWTLRDMLPFDFQRRRSSVLVERQGFPILITKGAPEALLALSSRIEGTDGTLRPLDAVMRAQLQTMLEEKGREGYRLLGVAWRQPAAGGGRLSLADESDLVFAGCLVFLDPPKASAADALRRLHAAGVRVKVISGDAEAVARHVAQAIDLPVRGVLTGQEIGRLTDAALAARAQHADLFVRVAPDQKLRIVRALRRRGHTVGFLGDGINDAPAIHGADVGLSVDGGTDVAREAADIILLAHDLGVLADGVAEGRRTYANIIKYVRMGTSSNFGNMLSMALASLVLPFLPLAPLQVLLNNLIYDLSEIGIPFDEVDLEDLSRPHAWNMGSVMRFTFIMGPLSSLFDAATFTLLLGLGADAEVFRTAWFAESIATQILVIFVIRTARPAWASRADPVLVSTSLGALAAALLLVFTPLGGVFGFVPLSPPLIAAIAGLSLVYLAMAEALKRFAFRHPNGRRGVTRRS